MKKIHLGLIILISTLLMGSLISGWIFLYINQNTVPKNVEIAGWPVGEQKIDDVIDQLDQHLKQLENTPVVVSADIQEGFDSLHVTLKEAGVSYHAEEVIQALQQLKEGSWTERLQHRRTFPLKWTITATYNPAPLKNKWSLAWQEEHFGLPENAVRTITTDDRVLLKPEVTAARIDWEGLTKLLTAAIPRDLSTIYISTSAPHSISLKLPLLKLAPEITIQSLKEEGIDRKIIEFSTPLGASGPGRVHNVSAAAKAVDGMILAPGDIFDYGEIIREAEQQYGFKEAPVIVNGALVPGIGGGICQVSSTVYSAAVRTGLEIVERRNHSLPVSYLPKGQDATFAEGAINFRFRNSTGKHLLIHAAVADRSLTVKFFGTFPENITYDIVSETVKVLAIPDKIIQDNSLPVGSRSIVQQGKEGYTVHTYQIKKVDGAVVEKKLLSKDTYRPQNRIIAVHNGAAGDSEPSPQAPDVVEDGLNSSTDLR